MELNIKKEDSKETVFEKISLFLKNNQLSVDSIDNQRPWGGFFKLQESDTQLFIDKFFNDVPLSQVKTSEKLSPKILIVQPHKRLSWQYHHRRSEIWKVISGQVQVVISDTDQQTEPQIKSLNEVIILKKGQRHRLIGDTSWGIVAEIWQHIEPNNPSNEEDIIRVADDFGR